MSDPRPHTAAAPTEPAEMSEEALLELQAELDELERTDPDVAAAAASYDRAVEQWRDRMSDGTAAAPIEQATQPADRSGWHEFTRYPEATTHIAYVHENGELYIPEGDVSEDDFHMAAAGGHVIRLVREESR